MDKLLFSDRKKLVDKYYEWLQEHPEVEDCPLNMIGWFSVVEILDINKSKELARR